VRVSAALDDASNPRAGPVRCAIGLERVVHS